MGPWGRIGAGGLLTIYVLFLPYTVSPQAPELESCLACLSRRVLASFHSQDCSVETKAAGSAINVASHTSLCAVTCPTMPPTQSQKASNEEKANILPSHGFSVDLPRAKSGKPFNIRHVYAQTA